jgi:hypothetical protein
MSSSIPTSTTRTTIERASSPTSSRGQKRLIGGRSASSSPAAPIRARSSPSCARIPGEPKAFSPARGPDLLRAALLAPGGEGVQLHASRAHHRPISIPLIRLPPTSSTSR